MPKLGELIRGRDIDEQHRRKANRGVWYVWVKCSQCSEERWTTRDVPEQACYTGMCRKCLTRTRNDLRVGVNGNHSSWKGGRIKTKEGYILIWLRADNPFFPMAMKRRYVGEHRLVMAKHLGRCLHRWETVHHKNSIRDDNRIENLELLPSNHSHYAITQMINYIKKLEKENECLRELEKIRRG